MEDSPDVISYPVCPREYGRNCDPNTHAYIVIHPEYDDNPESFINKDFALIFLPEKTDIIPVALNSNDDVPDDGSEVVAFGWGGLNPVPGPTDDDDFGTDDNGFVQEFPTIPEIVNVTTWSNEQCADAYINSPIPTAITSNQICANRINPKPGDSCEGDSGELYVFIERYLI